MVEPGWTWRPLRRRAMVWRVVLALGVLTALILAISANAWADLGRDPPAPVQERAESLPLSKMSSLSPVPNAREGAMVAGGVLMALLFQSGFALLSAGHCRTKNAAHVMMMSLVAFCVALLTFGAFGYALTGGYGSSPASIPILGRSFGLVGAQGFWLRDLPRHPEHSGTFLILASLAAVSATIPTGALAERWRFGSLAGVTIVISGLIFPVYTCWAWNGGWLMSAALPRMGPGFRDFAGASVVHLIGGVSAMAGALAIGPRIGKFSIEGRPRAIPGHDLTYVIAGTLLIAVGWSLLVVTRASTLTGVSTPLTAIALLLAGAAGCLSSAVASQISYGKIDPTFACNGLLGGLVAISGLGDWAEPFAAVLVGASAGVLSFWSALFVERILRVDDPANAIGVHGVCGALGCLCVGLFADGGGGEAPTAPLGLFFDGGIHQLTAQAIGMVAAVLWAMPASWLTFRLLGWTIGNRVTARAEVEGLDLSEVGAHAYMSEEPVALQTAGLDHLRTQGAAVPTIRSVTSRPSASAPVDPETTNPSHPRRQKPGG